MGKGFGLAWAVVLLVLAGSVRGASESAEQRLFEHQVALALAHHARAQAAATALEDVLTAYLAEPNEQRQRATLTALADCERAVYALLPYRGGDGPWRRPPRGEEGGAVLAARVFGTPAGGGLAGIAAALANVAGRKVETADPAVAAAVQQYATQLVADLRGATAEWDGIRQRTTVRRLREAGAGAALRALIDGARAALGEELGGRIEQVEYRRAALAGLRSWWLGSFDDRRHPEGLAAYVGARDPALAGRIEQALDGLRSESVDAGARRAALAALRADLPRVAALIGSA